MNELKSGNELDSSEQRKEQEAKYKTEADKGIKQLWQKIDTFEKQICSAMRSLSKYENIKIIILIQFREGKKGNAKTSNMLDPSEAPISHGEVVSHQQKAKGVAKKVTLGSCMTKLDNIFKISGILQKFAEVFARKINTSVIQKVTKALESLNERVDKVTISFEECCRNGIRIAGPEQADILEQEANTQRSNYAKLANELLAQSMIISNTIIRFCSWRRSVHSNAV